MSRDEKFITITLFIVFFSWACSRRMDTFEEPPAVQYDTLVDQVKAQAVPRTSFVNINKVKWSRFPNADLSFVASLMKRSVNNNDTIPTDAASTYHMYDFKDMDTLFLFSISRCDEGKFVSLYHFTLNKVSKQLSGCTLIGSGRKTPDHTLNDKLSYSKDGKSLIVNSSEERMEDKMMITDKCSIRFDFGRDSTWHRLLHNAHKEKMLSKL